MAQACELTGLCIKQYQKFSNWLFPILPFVWQTPKIPIDVLLPSQSNHASSYPEYAKKWEDQMRQAYQIAKIHSQERGKISIDITKVKSLIILKPGDRVLAGNLNEREGTGKLRINWKQKIHKIASTIGDDSVTYKIVPGNVMKPKDRTVHRNTLLN